MASKSRLSATFVAGSLTLGLLGGCAADEPDVTIGPQATASAPAVEREPDPTCPLTGHKPPRGVELDRPAVAIKVENSAAARPQSGLEEADLVFEEVVEGGITRFMAIYHCADAAKVGPVRSARFDDPKIAKPFTKLLVFSGGNPIVTGELTRRGLVALEEKNISGGALFRVPPGSLDVHSLFANTRKLRALKPAKKLAPPPRNAFRFGRLPKALQRRAKRTRSVRMAFSGGAVVEYRWGGRAWRRFDQGSPLKSSTGGQIVASNVLVQVVDVKPGGLRDSAGNPSPDIDVKGKGRAYLFRDGRVLRGTWNELKGHTPVFKVGKHRMVFAPGSIWVELLPSPRGAIKGSISIK